MPPTPTGSNVLKLANLSDNSRQLKSQGIERERERERERESIFFLYFESKEIKLIEKKTDVSLNIKVD